ncbi:MAG: C-GCAxxG-C-C family protein [Candidatus Thiodiazotropha sp. (ex Ctena orbiculata)]|nr:C-GCAxxG-C-C family protein [Candidatus Thiodiazotropha taylori]
MDIDRASRYMSKGYTCAESVLRAVSEEYGIEMEHPHVAMGFGGGMGFMGEFCGAMTGAVMAIGLVKGQGQNPEDLQKTMPLVQELRRRFETEMKTSRCRELTGIDLTKPGGLETLIESGISDRVCVPAVDTAYRIVMEFLKASDQAHVEAQ